MKKSLLFIPDISGFTNFVQTTEVEHSQHVIAELLEILIDAIGNEFQLAEIEGDALFFFKEEEIPSLEKLLAQVETIFTAFYSHLKLLEKNRICPCHACASAPSLDLKIIAHCGELQFISVKGNRKPFGSQVIEVHRLMKNTIDSDNYVLLSKELTDDIMLPENYQSKLFKFIEGKDSYDGKDINYLFSIIDQNNLKLKPFDQAKHIHFDTPPPIFYEMEFPISAPQLLEYITNFRYRHHFVKGVDKFEYDENEVNKLGTKHICVIDGKDLNFITVTKEGKPGQLIYGEMTTNAPLIDELYNFFILTPLQNNSCKLEMEIYWKTRSPIKRMIINLIFKRTLKKNLQGTIDNLYQLAKNKDENS